MIKNICFTFQKFSDPDWDTGAFERTYVPDEIFQPVLDIVKSHAGSILKYEHIIDQASREATKKLEWTWPATLGHTMRLWDELDPLRGKVFKDAVESACIKIEDVEPGRGGGTCYEDFIDFRRDRTLNDPVYLAHESGHLIATLMAPDVYNSCLPWNMTEMPAFFMQERAYDDLQARAANGEESRAIGLHRLADYISVLTRIPFCLWIMDQQKGINNPGSLRDAFAAWSIHDDKTVSRHENWMADPAEPLAYKAQTLHSHPLSSLLMIEFYRRFKKSDADAQKQMLNALYDRGANASLVDTLVAFGVKTEDDLKNAAQSACKHLTDQIKLLGFKKYSPAGRLDI